MDEVRYTCGSELRRQKVAAGKALPTDPSRNINGIDFVEVVDRAFASPPWTGLSDYRQRLLLIRCLRPVTETLGSDPISAENFTISGGVRVTDVAVTLAVRLPDLESAIPAGTLRNWLLALRAEVSADTSDDPDAWIVLVCDQTGDYSPYSLALIAEEGAELPPTGFDRVLSRVTLYFKVECPSDLDCQTAAADNEPVTPAPTLDYLARDYASFRRLMLDRLSVVIPAWQERNPADLGVALVEILAYGADHLAYYQDAVATEAYLETARRRVSVRRHARLLGYRMHDGCNARVWVHLQAAEGVDLGSATDPAVPASTRFFTDVGAEAVVSDESTDQLVARGAEVFEALHPLNTLTEAQNRVIVHTWGETTCCLPEGATTATLRVSPYATLGLAVGDWLLFEEERDADTGEEADRDPSRRHVVRLTAVSEPYDDEVEEQTVIDVSWDGEDALPFALCLHEIALETGQTEPASVARGNLVLVDHGRSVEADDGAPGQAVIPLEPESGRRYRPRLAEENPTFAAPYDDSTPAATVRDQDPREALPQVRLVSTPEDLSWSPQRDLLASARTATEFVVETEDSGRATLRFGDGTFGRAPLAGSKHYAIYRVGNGADGNIGAEAIRHVGHAVLNGAVVAVRNPLPAAGGTDPEPVRQVKRLAPHAFRTQQRAVTVEDWAEIARRHPQVSRAVATLRWTGSWTTVFLTVDPVGGGELDAELEAELLSFLDPYRMAGMDLELDGPRYVPLDIAFSVCVKPDYFQARVYEGLMDAFTSGVRADGRPGFFHPDNFTFGEPVYLSRLVAEAMRLPGVAWIDTSPNEGETGSSGRLHRFQRLREEAHGELLAGRIDMGRLEIARLDNDPSVPENGKLEFFMRGGL